MSASFGRRVAAAGRLAAAVWLCGGVALAAVAPPRNVLVNNPAADRFPIITQLEPSLAVSGSRVVIGWNDSGSSSGKFAGVGFGVGYGYSSDGGETFTDGGALVGGGLGGSNWGADPTLAVDRDGNFYIGRFALVSTSPSRGTQAGSTVYKSADGGVTFRQGTPPFLGSGTQDKPFLIVDKTGGPRDGTLYLTWTDVTGGSMLTVLAARSADQGTTFSSPVVVSGASSTSQSAMPAVGPDGELVITWYDSAANRIFFRKSMDGGTTFGPIIPVFGVNQIGSATICSATSRSGLKGDIRAANIPIIAVDASTGSLRGNIYIAIASAPAVGGPDMADVYLLRSTDGGSTWGSPLKVNDDATRNDQWLPFVAVGPDGTVGVMWYDRRRDSENLLIDVFMAISRNGGQSFGTNFRVTDVSFPVPKLNPNFDPLGAPDCYMGSSNSMVADAKFFYLAWTDNRLVDSGVPDPNIFFAKVPLTADLPAPTIDTQPLSQTVASGSTAVFRVEATGAATYQWQRNGTVIAGATAATLVLTRVTAADAGNYACVAANAASGMSSAAATLGVSTTADAGRLINLSILTSVTASDPLFTVGTVIGGAGTNGTKPLLIRAAGPSLAPLGVAGVLADPKLDVFTGQTLFAANDNWSGSATLAPVFTAVGAFSYSSALSKDAAVYDPAAPAGAYTIQISGVGDATGAVIAEIYDATPAGSFAATTPHLLNVSVLKNISTGTTLTAGFVIGGATSKTVLIRAIGPRLGLPPFSLVGIMMDPALELYRGQRVLAANDNWSGEAPIADAGAAVGAFAVTDAASKDAMLLVTLPPGSYTAQVTAASGAGGLAMVEVYELP